MEKITFIIPSINRSSLKDSIDSLLRQTNPNWECIIIYDGVCGPKFKDNRIRTINIKKSGNLNGLNGEAGIVRNHGIRLCETKWIAFLDDDDILKENYVEDLYEKYSVYDFVIFRMQYDDMILPLNTSEIVKNEVGISFCYKKNIFKDLFFEKNNQNEDYFFITKLLSLSKKFIITDEVYYIVRKLPKNFNWKFYLEHYEDLRNAGLKTKEDAERHYLNHGRYEHRVYKV